MARSRIGLFGLSVKGPDMKKWFAAVFTLFLVGAPAPAQLLGRQYTNPTPPSRQALDRVNLNMAWRAYIPVQGRRDGLFSFQLIDRQILVQTLSGLIVSLDADTGVIEWKARMGLPYHASALLGFNKKSVFALRGDHLFSVERATGRIEWKFILPDGPTAGALADAEGVYLVLGASKVYAYILPDLVAFRRARAELAQEKAKEAEKLVRTLDIYKGASGMNLEKMVDLLKEVVPEPELAWDYLTEGGRILQRPLQTANALFFVASNGTILSTNKFTREERYRFRAESEVSAPMGQHGNFGYVASDDAHVYAVDIPHGRIVWRFTAGAAIRQKPEVTDRDVFVKAERRGLVRVNRRDGKFIWQNPRADRFLAMNRKFVYAFDREGRLLVLDRHRGLTLGMLNTRDFVFPISNEQTDRVFLAAHNGLLVCLHDHNQKTPLINKTVREEKIAGFKPKEEPKPKEEEKPKPKDKDKDKDKDNEDKKDKDKEEKMEKEKE
jgi:outer membrane protein assembly factor BamB